MNKIIFIILFLSSNSSPAQKNGWLMTYFSDGQVKEQKFYCNNIIEGYSREWNSKGVLLFEDLYFNGKNIEHRIFDSNGCIIYQYNFFKNASSYQKKMFWCSE